MKKKPALQYTRLFAFSGVLVCLTFLLQSCSYTKEKTPRSPALPRNIILMISDGMGPSAITMAREYWGKLVLDDILTGTIRTRSHSSAVTDSAAGATAFATGVRTYNRAVSVSPTKQPLTTLLLEAKRKGMATGLVVTSAIAHATPAAFSAHAVHRKLMLDIAEQQAEANIDLLLGGGHEDWLPKDKGGCRTDGKDLLKNVQSNGYQLATYQQGVLNIKTLPAIGLFARNNIAYAIDHNNTSGPTLQQMTSTALALLSKQSGGFFLMIEGSRIDHAAHVNDPTTELHEIKAYDDTVKAVLEFAKQNGETLVVSVSDHETGGMSQGRRIGDKSHYNWRPQVIQAVTASTDHIAKQIIAGSDPVQTVRKYTGIKILNRAEQEQLIKLSSQARHDKNRSDLCSGKWQIKDLAKHLKQNNDKKITTKKRLMYWIGEKISREAYIGWTTYGHTGIDVNLYTFGPAHEKFRGNNNNTAVATIIAELMGFRKILAQAKKHEAF